MNKVTIEPTSDQKDHIRTETGQEVDSLTVEQLEDRDAPTVRSAADFGLVRAKPPAIN